ncbi:hypothetical protein V3C99_001539, partial [Haemonchus contortus]
MTLGNQKKSHHIYDSEKKGPEEITPRQQTTTSTLRRSRRDLPAGASYFVGQNRPPRRRWSKMAVCTFNARTLAPEACIEDLMMTQARKIKNDVIGL